MRVALLILALCLCPSIRAATYYISPSCNDTTGNGSSGSPWLTYVKAAPYLAAGDTLVAKAGIYPSTGNQNYYLNPVYYYRFTTAATPESPITIQAETAGQVTNQFGFLFQSASNYVVKDFVWDGWSSGGLNLYNYSDRITVTNCTFQNGDCGFNQANGIPTVAASYCNVMGCRFLQITNTTCVGFFGTSNLAQGNYFANCGSSDIFRPMGSNNTMRLNIITNLFSATGYGNHPDVIQFFGDNGYWATALTFEQNYIVGGAGYQFMDLSMQSTGAEPPTVHTNSEFWGMEVRNNVLVDAIMQCSINVPNMHFVNNTFRRCSGAGISFGFYDPNYFLNGVWQCRGWSTGGYAINNAFLEGSANYATPSTGPDENNLTNGVGTVKGHANVQLGGGFWDVWGTYEGLSGTITSGTLYCAHGDLYTIAAGSFSAGAFSAHFEKTDPAGPDTYAVQAGHKNSGTLWFRINTDTEPNGEAANILPLYVADTSSVTDASDYNFHGWVTEPHGIASGVTNLVGVNSWPVVQVAPMLGSCLIDAGSDLTSAGVTKDYFGLLRPQNGTFDIGAIEYDPSLKLRFDFDESITGRILDITGNGNNGVQMDSTNWISTTNGAFQTTAGFLYYNGDNMVNDPPHVYPMGEYAAITNTTGFSQLTTGTISLWAQFSPNTDLQMVVLDTGYTPAYSGNPTLASNSWAVARNSHAYLSFLVYPTGLGSARTVVNFPSDVIQAGGGNPNLGTAAMHLYTVTVDCSKDEAIAYYDGAPYQTNTLGIPYIRVYGGAAKRWVCVGAMAHDGTPEWGDDLYPNSAFFVGTLDDLRIYDRVLSDSEVLALYTGQGTLGPAGEPDPAISVTPSSRDFGTIAVGSTQDESFTVENTGGGTLSGTASVSSPFSVISGSPYSLAASATATVTVRFSPSSASSYSQTVTFTGGAGATTTVSGVSTNVPAPSTSSRWLPFFIK